MKKYDIRMITAVLFLLFHSDVFAQAKSPLPTVTIKCPLFSQEEAKSIQNTCSLINDADFEQMYKDCQKKSSQSGSCAAQSVELDGLISELRSSSTMRNYSDFAAGGATRSLDRIKTILDQLEKMKLQGNCAPQSLAFKLLPLASIINAPLTFAAASAAQLLSRTYKLLSDEKNDYGTKFSLCQANAYARESRSIACQQSVLAARDKSLIEADTSALEKRIEDGKKSNTNKLLIELNSFSQEIAKIEKQDDSKNTNDSALFIARFSIEDAYKLLNCDDKKEKFLTSTCADIAKAKDLLEEKNFDWKIDSKERRETIQKLSRFASQNWYSNLQAETSYSGAYAFKTDFAYRSGTYYQILEYASPSDGKRRLPRLNESAQKSLNGLLAFYHMNISDVISPLNKDSESLLSSKASAEQMDLAIEAFPMSFNIEKDKSQCAVVSCLWAKASPDSVPQKFKSLHEHSWDITGPQSIAQLTTAGNYYKAWKVRLNAKAKPLNKMFQACAKTADKTCKLSCDAGLENSKLNELATPANFGNDSDSKDSAR